MSDRKYRILIVDDHADTRDLMQLLLRRLGYETASADSIATAIEVCRNTPIDLLLSDLGLPDGNGLDLLKQLQPMGVTRGVALTGHGRQSDVQAAREAGFGAHLLKPVDLQLLKKTVADMLEA